MEWFGESWEAPVCHPQLHIPYPEGKACALCLKLFEPEDQGVCLPYFGEAHEDPSLYYHRWCFLESILGPDLRREIEAHGDQEQDR